MRNYAEGQRDSRTQGWKTGGGMRRSRAQLTKKTKDVKTNQRKNQHGGVVDKERTRSSTKWEQYEEARWVYGVAKNGDPKRAY